MKKILLGLFTITMIGGAGTKALAQAFTTPYDTVNIVYNTSGAIDYHNDITANGQDISVKWKVIDTDFDDLPTWATAAAVSVCDNNNCFTNTGTFPGLILDGTEYTSSPYTSGQAGLFKLTLDLTNATPSSSAHYITFELRNASADTVVKNITYMVSKFATSVNSVNKNTEDITLFPNPVRDEVNVVFNDLNVKNIAVYNVIGKNMIVYRTSGTSAKLDMSKFPSGVYFLRMSDAKGAIVATKRITKQ